MNVKYVKPSAEKAKMLGAAVAIVQPLDEPKQIKAFTAGLHLLVSAGAKNSTLAVCAEVRDIIRETQFVPGSVVRTIYAELDDAVARVEEMAGKYL